MAQAAQTPEQASIADGATSTFPISFTFADSAEVRVTVDSGDGPVMKIEAVDYVVSGANVVFLSGKTPPAGARVARRRNTPVDQPEPFGDQATFRPVANEVAFDKLTRIAQENRARGARGLAVPIGEVGVELPDASSRAGTVAIWSDTGAAIRTDRTLTAFDGDVAQTAAERAAAQQAASAAAGSQATASAAAATSTAQAAAAELARQRTEAALAAALLLTGVVVPIVPSVGAVAESAPGVGGQAFPAGVNVLQVQLRAPNYALPSTLTGKPYKVVRLSKADIDASDSYPARAVFRTADRIMPDGTTHATNGGYWVIAEPILEAEMFGQLGLSTAETTATLSAFHEMAWRTQRRGELTGGDYTINGPLLEENDRANGALRISRRGPVKISVAGGTAAMHSVLYARTTNPCDIDLSGAPLEINANTLARYGVFVGHNNGPDGDTVGGFCRIRNVTGRNLLAPIDTGSAAVLCIGRFAGYDFAHNHAYDVNRAPSVGGMDGECKGLYITGAVGSVAMHDCHATRIHAQNNRDSDGLGIFGPFDPDTGLPLLLQASFTGGCTITDAQVRSIKTQAAETFVEGTTRFIRTDAMTACEFGHEVGAQYGGLEVGPGWRAEYAAGSVHSSHIVFIAQPLYDDRAGKAFRIGKGQIVSAAAFRGLAYLIMGADSPHVVVDIEDVAFEPAGGLSGSMFSRDVFEFDASQLASATNGSLHVKIHGTRGPNTGLVIGYTGYNAGTHGSLASKLGWDVDGNINTLTPLNGTRLAGALSGGAILNVPRGRFGANPGYSNFFAGAVAVNLGDNGLPSGHEMTVDLSAAVITNGPAGLPASGFATIWTRGYSLQPYQLRGVDLEDGQRKFETLSGSWVEKSDRPMLLASVSFDPPSLAAGAASSIQTTTVTGAALGDHARASFSADLSGVVLHAWVSAPNTVKWFVQNVAGSNPTDLASGNVLLRVEK